MFDFGVYDCKKNPFQILEDDTLKCVACIKAIPFHETGLVTKAGWAR
jgi:hypothetical protein